MATPSPRAPRRRAVAALGSLLLAALLLGVGAGSAQAADGYRYWNYFHVKNGAFAFATTGAAGYTPADGATEAYRFGTSTAQEGLEPRADLGRLGFDTVCRGTDAEAGKKRVAVLIDYGTAADASGSKVPEPRAACAVVPAKANGQQVLDAVADLRLSKGLLCGVDGYPASGCGEPVKDASVPADQAPVEFALPSDSAAPTRNVSHDDGGGNTPLLVGGAVVVLLLLGGGVALTRRNRTA